MNRWDPQSARFWVAVGAITNVFGASLMILSGLLAQRFGLALAGVTLGLAAVGIWYMFRDVE